MNFYAKYCEYGAHKTEVNQLQVFTGDNQTESIPRCCANNDFFNKVMQSETSTFIENLDEVNIPIEHKQYASLAKSRMDGLYLYAINSGK